MVSMAQPLDLAAKATWPITLGESITATKRGARLTSVRYNARPPKTTLQRTIRATRGDECEAVFKDKDQQEWKYSGRRAGSETDYVLLLEDEEGQKSARLERLDAVVLNVVSTPAEQDAVELRRKHRHINAYGEAEIETVDDDIPQADNPFDYRHFLDDETVSRPVAGNNVDTPVQRASSTRGASTTKRKPETTQAAAKRSKTAAGTLKSKTSIPAVRLERKASLRPPVGQDNDDGELILENDDDDARASTLQRRQGAMAMALTGQLGRPISLHSAASSPASILNSPMPERPDNEAEYDLGGSDVDMHDADGDVEDFDLPSPIQHTSTIRNIEFPAEDEDDAFTKELEMAMAAEDARVPAPVEEESEEE